MRRLMLAFILTVLFGCMGLTTTGLGLAVLSPFHAGSLFFPAQELAEQGLVLLIPEPVARVNIQMDQMTLRAADLAVCPDSKCAHTALSSWTIRFEQVLIDLAHLPESTTLPFRNQLLTLLDRVKLAALQSQANRTEIEALLARLTIVQPILGDPSRPLSSLLTQAQVETQPALLPQNLDRANRIQPQPVSGRMVVFPAGSVGAMHAFFPLTGKHQGLECRACHSQGLYAGTPTACSACHTADAPQKHYPAECSLCHTAEAWSPASFSHQAVDTSDCAACHLQNRPAEHYNGQCSACHNTSAWTPATFNHQAAGATDCAGCHTNKRPANHYNGQCSACHSTNAWKPATFNHQAAGATDCAGCHTNKRPANHYNGQCSACHSTNAWKPATFNHQAAGATDCAGCHSGRRPDNHFGGQCSACHSTSAWKPAGFNHQAAGATDCAGCHSGARPANHFAGQCSDCHSTDSWKGARFNHSFPLDHGDAKGQCAACHPGGGSSWSCFGCHDQGKLDKKHNEKGISNYASRCLDCHAGGRGGDD